MRKQPLILSFFLMLSVAVALAGCTTVRKGAGAVGDGVGAVAKDTGNVIGGVGRGVGSVFGGLAPKRQLQEVEPGDEPEGDVVEVTVDGETKRFVNRIPNINPFGTYPFKRLYMPDGDATDSQLLRERAWAKVIDQTEVRLIGDDRVRINVFSPFVMAPEDMEYLLLARAAGEATRAGYPRFAIVYLNYEGGTGLSALLLPEISMAGDDWIGAYEELIVERENQRLVGDISRFGSKRLEAVVRFMPAEDMRRRETFAATETYLNMLNEKLFGGEYPYTR